MIRKATAEDAGRIGELLYQVHAVHAEIRPDIFKTGQRKYNGEEIAALIAGENNAVFVYEDETGEVQGYALCEYRLTRGSPSLHERKVLYIDDFCVAASQRGKKIGEALYRYVRDAAKAANCDSLTLAVWEGNAGAQRFYRRLGFEPLKTLLEQKL